MTGEHRVEPALGLTSPLFDGGSLRAEKRAAVDAMHASAATYEQTVLEAFGQVADCSRRWITTPRSSMPSSSAASRAEQLDLARASYAEGNAGVLQVLDAERLYQQARLGYVGRSRSATSIPCSCSWRWAAPARAPM